jgi:hypothetical protein
MTEAGRHGGFTPVPNYMLDSILPALKDTELRVLLIVLRETTGRGGKPCDWLAHSQLKARTGRASEAISAAINALVIRGLLVVTDADSISLSSTSSRRAYRGKLYYRVGSPLKEKYTSTTSATQANVNISQRCMTAKAKTTEDIYINNTGRLRKSGDLLRNSEVIRWHGTPPTSDNLTPERVVRMEAIKAKLKVRLALLRDKPPTE